MRKGTKEFEEIQYYFEKYITGKHFNHYLPVDLTRAPKDAKHIYENGAIDMAFDLYFAGYALGRSVYMEPGVSNISGTQCAFKRL
jgi:hypothetical protein